MSLKVVGRPVAKAAKREPPRRVKRTSDWGVESVVAQLEVQPGTVKAYDCLVEGAERIRRARSLFRPFEENAAIYKKAEHKDFK